MIKKYPYKRKNDVTYLENLDVERRNELNRIKARSTSINFIKKRALPHELDDLAILIKEKRKNNENN
jgi:hypothetical protein